LDDANASVRSEAEDERPSPAASNLTCIYQQNSRGGVRHRVESYPLELATPIAIDSVRQFVETGTDLEEIIFCCYSGEDFSTYKRMLRRGGLAE
jgi:hypothetical protein